MINNEKQSPKVSVCVVTYNQENYITECLQSIVDQETDFEFEVIVSDDCSTDRTRDIIREFAAKYPCIIPVLREQNIGPLQNFVQTHNMAQGEYVCHLDGDDYWLQGKLQIQADFLGVNTDFTVVWGRMNLFSDNGGISSGNDFDYSQFISGVVTFEEALKMGSIGIHSSIMYRKWVRHTINPLFDVVDHFYTLEFLSQGKGKILNNIVGAYRKHDVGITITSSLKIEEAYINTMRYYLKKYPHQKANIFMFSLYRFLVYFKKNKNLKTPFFLLMRESFSYISPYNIYQHIKNARKLHFPLLSYTEKTSIYE